jgi:adenylate kinase family enzyme
VKAHIIGIAGSGKTSLARWIGARHGVPVHDLDWLVYEPGRMRTLDEIGSGIDAIRRASGWVTEGAYRDAWLRPLLDEAETVIWLDYSLGTCAYRIVKRHVQAEVARNNPHPGWRRLLSFLDYNRRTHRGQRRETAELVGHYKDTLTVVRSGADLARVKQRLSLR